MRQIKNAYDIAYPNITQSDHIAASLPSLAIENNHELFRAQASMWTEIFPDELVINELTVSVIQRSLFLSSMATILVKDIGRVVYADAIFFARLEILGKNTAHDLHVEGLHKHDALHAQEIIENLLLSDLNSQETPLYSQLDTKRR